MGLCKCPKRKVSTLFCFEHRVNVCETCLVSDHPRCVVQTYLQWLQDSDYNPNCLICNVLLNEQETIRFLCLHVFHINCVDVLFSRMAINTAPNGYKCYSCKDCVFFTPNVKSPLAEDLRQKFKHLKLSKFSFDIDSLSGVKDIPKTISPNILLQKHYIDIASPQSDTLNATPKVIGNQEQHDNMKKEEMGYPTPHSHSPNEHHTISQPIKIDFAQPDESKGKHSFQKNTTKDNLTRKFILMGKQLAFNTGLGKHGKSILNPYMFGVKSRRFLLFVLFLCLCTLFVIIIRYHTLSNTSSDGYDSLNNDWGNFDPMLNPANNPMIKIRRN